jgi:hypothetical protein
MMKRLAAAVVAAFVNLLGSAAPNANADTMTALVTSADADGPDTTIDCVEYRRPLGGSGGGGASRPVVLAMASAVCGEPIDAAWLVRRADDPLVAVAAQLRPDHVAVLDVMAAPARRFGPGLSPASRADLAEPLHRALAFCRDGGALKVVVAVNAAAGVVPVDALRVLAGSSGFQFTRARRLGDSDVVELYTDLYWTEEHAPAARPRAERAKH